jgi:hypothetical protein
MSKASSIHCCDEMRRHLEDGDVAIVYRPNMREYGICILDGNPPELVLQVINFCPWCGKRLPGSLRDQWFDRLWQMGLDVDSPPPKEMQDDTWWRKEDGTEGTA